VKAAAPKPTWAKAGVAASYGSASHASRQQSAPTQNIENNPMQSSRRSPAWMLYPPKHFDTSGKSAALFHRRSLTSHPQMEVVLGVDSMAGQIGNRGGLSALALGLATEGLANRNEPARSQTNLPQIQQSVSA